MFFFQAKASIKFFQNVFKHRRQKKNGFFAKESSEVNLITIYRLIIVKNILNNNK